ncbi:MAG: polysaccharide lyase [Solirubrobacterales bacterium]
MLEWLTERQPTRRIVEVIAASPTRRWLSTAMAVAFVTAACASAASSAPIALHPQNPHYFLWRDKPTVLITSGEHYGAVLNRAFDYKRYLDTLQSYSFNLTRTFSGAYCEAVGAFSIENNTLAPAAGNLLCPWARSDQGGYANGGNKFDLTQWDPEYFRRLSDFVSSAGRRGIVVELVLFCPFYEDSMWDLSPMNIRNNVNGIGDMPRTEVYTLNHPELLAVQDAMVRRIVEAMKDFDNLYYEICNEPYFGGVTLDWQAHIAETITATEAAFEHKHLIAQNIANNTQKIENPNPRVSIFNFHYAKPPVAVAENYGLSRVIADDETGFSGDDRVKPYRLEGWDFVLAGGAVYSNLDYSFAVGREDGSNKINAPGGGGPELQSQLRILKDFIHRFDFVRMRPDNSAVKTALPKEITARVLAEPGQAYAIYVNGGGLTELALELPPGEYGAEWLNTKTGQTDKAEPFRHEGGARTLQPPSYVDDVALRIVRLVPPRNERVLLFRSTFDDGDFRGWKISGNPPTIVHDQARAGTGSMRTSLDRNKDRFPDRTEIQDPRSDIGKEYWYGFSILLPEDYVPDRIWEIVAQWQATPDTELGEKWRNPVLALSTTNGRWGWVSRWDAKRNTYESGKREYGGVKEYDLGEYERGVWTDWVVHVKWSYESDGLLQIWKDGKPVVDQNGPNAYNDATGPFFKMGLYKGWGDPKKPGDAVIRRVLYHDEFRMAGADAVYQDVAPGLR